ncbi:MAG: DUF859 family phage minor structural protein [Ruminococcus flavefaciens]|nr:DUF859 family phage minor structural protein [Ruminococcus flavefaciens]
MAYNMITMSWKRTDTTITISWSTKESVDKVWYSIDDGASWKELKDISGTYGSYELTGLLTETTYKIITRVRLRSGQQTVDSSALTVTTLSYPFANLTPDLTIGDTIQIRLFNPFGRAVTYQILAEDGGVVASGSTSGESFSFDSAACEDRLYASIPDSVRGQYSVRVDHDGQTSIKKGGRYSVDTSICKPSVEMVYYADVNEKTLEITGNQRLVVQNQSKVQITASGMTAKKYASIADCTIEVNGITADMPLDGAKAVSEPIILDSTVNLTAVVTVTDSRGLTVNRNLPIIMAAWSVPSAIISIQRRNNFYSETEITVNANFSSVDGKNAVTIIYLVKKEGEKNWDFSNPIENNVTSMVRLDNDYAWEIAVIIDDLFGGTVTYRRQLPRGMPIIFFDRLRSSVGINCFPKEEKSLEVGGVNVVRSVMTRRLSTEFTNAEAGYFAKVPFDREISSGSKLSPTEDGGIKIGANVRKVLVSGQLLVANS